MRTLEELWKVLPTLAQQSPGSSNSFSTSSPSVSDVGHDARPPDTRASSQGSRQRHRELQRRRRRCQRRREVSNDVSRTEELFTGKGADSFHAYEVWCLSYNFCQYPITGTKYDFSFTFSFIANSRLLTESPSSSRITSPCLTPLRSFPCRRTRRRQHARPFSSAGSPTSKPALSLSTRLSE